MLLPSEETVCGSLRRNLVFPEAGVCGILPSMADWTLKHLAGSTYYIPAAANIGVYCSEEGVYLIDSGNDAEAGRQIRKLLDAEKLTLLGIINTHSHADHIGGNAYLQKRTDCRIFAPRREAMFVEYPEYEPAFLFGGAPHADLKNKHLMAAASTVSDPYEGPGMIAGTPLRSHPLPGHSCGMCGISTPDGVLFTADAVLDRSIIDKYGLFYLYDIPSHISSLNQLKELSFELFVPSHGSPCPKIGDAVSQNLQAVAAAAERMRSVLAGVRRISFEDFLAEVCRSYRIKLNHLQYVLMRSTVCSYISWMAGLSEVTLSYSENRMFLSIYD